MLKISFIPPALPKEGTLILTVAAGQKLGPAGVKLNRKLGNALRRAMSASNSFKGEKGQTLSLMAPAKTKLAKLLLVGLGAPGKADSLILQHVGGTIAVALQGRESAQAVLVIDEHKGLALPVAAAGAEVAFGAKLRSYRFDKYRTRLKSDQRPALKTLSLASGDVAAARRAFADLDKVADGVAFARDLIIEPANVITPETLAAECLKLKGLGLSVDVLDEKQMQKMGMGALLGVAQGSVRPPRFVSLVWQGQPTAKDKRPIAFVGKGVTFDTGGISLKPPGGMEEMKTDMAGAAAVIGTMKVLAARKAAVHAVGLVGLAENMLSGAAQRPGDIVTSLSGQTIEVINTDAEGRLVLADALWYAQEKFNPRCLIDLATLTGAMIVALGRDYAGLFANDDKLAEQLTQAGQATDEKVWRFPMGESYDKTLDSSVADMKNVPSSREAGSITAAQFLQRFVKKGTAWAHIDIAGTARLHKDAPTCPKGPSGFGVRLLDKLVAECFEGKI